MPQQQQQSVYSREAMVERPPADFWLQEFAATIIQKYCRGYLARKHIRAQVRVPTLEDLRLGL